MPEQNDITSLQNSKTKINFRIISCTSSDSSYNATELESQSPESKGWQSQRFCTYPQVIIIQLHPLAIISKLTFLSHQSKITTQIDIQSRQSQTASWKKLGYTCMESNMSTNYSSRQLRTVKLSKQLIKYIRLSLHHNYMNSINIFNQVSLIAIGVYGQKYHPQPLEDIKQKGILEPGAVLDKQTLDKLRQLQYMKREAIDNNDFQKASQIKHQIDKLKNGVQALAILQRQKRQAIKREDYEQAKRIYQKMKKIRGPIPRAVVSSNDRYDQANKANQYERNKSTFTPVVYNNKFNSKNKSLSYDDANNQPNSPIQQLKKGKKKSLINKQRPTVPVNFDDIPIKTNNNNGKNIFEQQQPQLQSMHSNTKAKKDLNKPKFTRNKVPLQKSHKFQQPVYQQQQPHDQKPFQCTQYFTIIPQLTWDNLFSKDKNLRQHALQQVLQLNSTLQNQQYLQKLFINSVILIVKHRINDKIISVLLKTIDLLGMMFKQFKPKVQEITKDSVKYLKTILEKLAEYLGHSNQKLKGEVEDVYIILPKYSKVTSKQLCIETITLAEQVDRVPRSIIAKLQMLGKLIKKYDQQSLVNENKSKFTKQKYEDVIEYAKRYLEDRNSEVRSTAVKLLAFVGKIIGPDQLLKSLEDVREVTRNLIENKLNNNDNSQHNNNNDGQKLKNINSSMNNDRKSRSPPKILSPKRNQKSPNQQFQRSSPSSPKQTIPTKKPSSPIKKSPVAVNKKPLNNNNQQQPIQRAMQNNFSNNYQPKNPQYQCEYCQQFDKRFQNQNFRDVHWFKSCPMIAACKQCHQCIQVQCYNQHLLQECQKKKFYKKCPRCKQAVGLKQFNKHVQSKTCVAAKPLNVANRCPLCHQDVEPKKKGLLKHLKQQGCPCFDKKPHK